MKMVIEIELKEPINTLLTLVEVVVALNSEFASTSNLDGSLTIGRTGRITGRAADLQGTWKIVQGDVSE